MNNLWKGIAIFGMWGSVAISVIFVGQTGVLLGLFAMFATIVVASF